MRYNSRNVQTSGRCAVANGGNGSRPKSEVRAAKGLQVEPGPGRATGKTLAALSLLTLFALILIGRLSHPGDAAGAATGGVRDFLGAAGSRSVPVSQVGVNALASQVGHVRV